MKYSLYTLSSILLISIFFTPSIASNNIYDSIVRASGNNPRYTHSDNPANQETRGQTYFNTVLDASNIRYTPQQLSFQRRECANYGEEAITGLQQEACINTRTTIDLTNFEVVEATNGLFLIKKQKLIVRAKIKREFLNIDSLDKNKADHIRAQLKTNPETINIPVHKDYNPEKVAKKLGN